MKNKIYSILLFSLTLACIQFIACKKDCDPNNPPDGQTVDLFAGDKLSLFPYQDFQTIKFIKNNTDTVTFLGSKLETGYYKAFNQNLDCPQADKLQFYKYVFTSNFDGIITLYEYILPQYNDYNSDYSISFKDVTFGPIGSSDVIGYSDPAIIYIGGKSYTSVFKFNGTSATTNVYFVHNVGVIKIIYKSDIYDRLP